MSSCYPIPVISDEWFVRDAAPSWACGATPQPREQPDAARPRDAEPSDWWIGALNGYLSPQTSLVWKRFADIAAVVNEFPPDDHEAVVGFLLEHHDLPESVAESARHVWELFGQDARLTLHLMHDPDEGFEELFLVIGTDRELGEAFDQLDRFDNWFVNQPFSVRRYFNVTIS